MVRIVLIEGEADELERVLGRLPGGSVAVPPALPAPVPGPDAEVEPLEEQVETVKSPAAGGESDEGVDPDPRGYTPDADVKCRECGSRSNRHKKDCSRSSAASRPEDVPLPKRARPNWCEKGGHGFNSQAHQEECLGSRRAQRGPAAPGGFTLVGSADVGVTFNNERDCWEIRSRRDAGHIHCYRMPSEYLRGRDPMTAQCECGAAKDFKVE